QARRRAEEPRADRLHRASRARGLEGARPGGPEHVRIPAPPLARIPGTARAARPAERLRVPDLGNGISLPGDRARARRDSRDPAPRELGARRDRLEAARPPDSHCYRGAVSLYPGPGDSPAAGETWTPDQRLDRE